MRCLSSYSRYGIRLFGGDERIVNDPRGYAISIPIEEPVIAQFDKLGLLPHEEDLALQKLNFTTLPEGVHPLTRVGVFDSEAYCLNRWPDDDDLRNDMQVKIDKALIDRQAKFPSHYICVEEPRAAKPWPSYDEDSVEDILKLQERLAFSPESVRRYEQENENRKEIVDAMTELEQSGLADEITVNA
jgi:hypothetical protein